MPRYDRDVYAPRGMDPNHRGPYGGMRMQAGPRQAAYGMHRMTHPLDFEGSGGDAARFAYEGDYRGGGGGVRGPRYDREMMREFNAASLRFRDEGQGRSGRRARYDGGYEGRRSGYDGGFRWDYGNRGLSSGGYTDSWTWGPMRGSR